MYKRRDRNINFYVVHIVQTKCSIKYISIIYGGVSVMQSEKKILVTKPIIFITIT